MERHIQILLNRLSFASITIATLTLLTLFLQTPETCLTNLAPQARPHPKSTCDHRHRPLTTLSKKNHRIWSTSKWVKTVHSFSALFTTLQSLSLLHNHSRVLCVSAGAGHEVRALADLGVSDVTGVELVDSPPLVSRADPHNLPFFDGVFDLGFSARLDLALFPSRFAREMERTVRGGGVCVVAVEECGGDGLREVAELFQKSRLVSAHNVSLSCNDEWYWRSQSQNLKSLEHHLKIAKIDVRGNKMSKRAVYLVNFLLRHETMLQEMTVTLRATLQILLLSQSLFFRKTRAP